MLEDIGAGFCFHIDVVSMWFECYSPVICHFECGGRGGVGYQCVVEYYCGLFCISGTRV